MFSSAPITLIFFDRAQASYGPAAGGRRRKRVHKTERMKELPSRFLIRVVAYGTGGQTL
jgi:hypothetical protein